MTTSAIGDVLPNSSPRSDPGGAPGGGAASGSTVHHTAQGCHAPTRSRTPANRSSPGCSLVSSVSDQERASS